METDATEIIAESLEQVAERVGDPAPLIFARLFAEFPQTQTRFERDTSGAIRGEMLAMVFDCLMDPGGPYQAAMVRAERVNHDGFGTPSAEFDRFFGVVRDTCRDSLGADWTPAFEAAWGEQIARVLSASK